jgi:hypothetical protein
MKNAVIIVSLLIASAPVFAFPTVGDQATLNIVSSSGGVIGTDSYTVTAIDPIKDQLQYTETLNESGVPQTITNGFASISETAASMQLGLSLNGCMDIAQATNGTLAAIEAIQVLGHTMNSCHINYTIADPDGTTDTVSAWLGDVPFGIIKEQVQTSTYSFGLEVASFTQN